MFCLTISACWQSFVSQALLFGHVTLTIFLSTLWKPSPIYSMLSPTIPFTCKESCLCCKLLFKQPKCEMWSLAKSWDREESKEEALKLSNLGNKTEQKLYTQLTDWAEKKLGHKTEKGCQFPGLRTHVLLSCRSARHWHMEKKELQCG